MAIRATVNQVVQIGVEATPGTAVACGKLLQAFTWTFGEKAATKQFRGTGRQYPSASALLTEYAAGKISGPGDFAQLIYPFASLWGSGSPALHSPSTTAYDWIWTPGLSGSYVANAKTFTVQNGDTNDAEQYAYLIFTGAGYNFTRKQEMQITGDWIAQTFTDGQALTASPVEVEQLPVTGAQFNVYLDPTSGAIGTTQLVNTLKFAYTASGYYAPYFPVNRANASFTSPVDLEKKHEVKLTLEAGSTGIAIRGTYLELGAKAYVRVAGVGPTIDSGHSVTAAMTHDMAVVVSDMAELTDVDGVYGVEYTMVVAEDTAWNGGQAQKMTLTNLVSAL